MNLQDGTDLTLGEAFFESYLKQHGYSWTPEHPAGSKKPDYMVDTETGKVLCEVKDFGENDQDKAVLKAGLLSIREHATDPKYLAELQVELDRLQAIKPASAGRFDPIPRLQDKARRANKQMRALKGQVPCVLIVFNPGPAPNDHDLFIRLSIGNKRIFNTGFNTTISAVAVLETFFPNQHILESARSRKIEELEKLDPGITTCDRASMTKTLEALDQFDNHFLSQFPDGYFEESHPRLRIYRNPHAVLALPYGTFATKNNLEFDSQELWSEE